MRDVSKLGCKIWPKLRTFQTQNSKTITYRLPPIRQKGAKRTRHYTCSIDEPFGQRSRPINASLQQHRFSYPSLRLPTSHQSIQIPFLLATVHLPYRHSQISIRPSFVCHLELSPARHSATSSFSMRSTLGKSLPREEVSRNYKGNGYVEDEGNRGMSYCFSNEYGCTDIRASKHEQCKG